MDKIEQATVDLRLYASHGRFAPRVHGRLLVIFSYNMPLHLFPRYLGSVLILRPPGLEF